MSKSVGQHGEMSDVGGQAIFVHDLEVRGGKYARDVFGPVYFHFVEVADGCIRRGGNLGAHGFDDDVDEVELGLDDIEGKTVVVTAFIVENINEIVANMSFLHGAVGIQRVVIWHESYCVEDDLGLLVVPDERVIAVCVWVQPADIESVVVF